MTTRQLITLFLQREGTASAASIHSFVAANGGRRETSMSMLSDMAERGEVRRHRFRSEYICWLAERGTVAEVQPAKKVNVVFDECRTHSRVYQFDQLLRAAREVRA